MALRSDTLPIAAMTLLAAAPAAAEHDWSSGPPTESFVIQSGDDRTGDVVLIGSGGETRSVSEDLIALNRAIDQDPDLVFNDPRYVDWVDYILSERAAWDDGTYRAEVLLGGLDDAARNAGADAAAVARSQAGGSLTSASASAGSRSGASATLRSRSGPPAETDGLVQPASVFSFRPWSRSDEDPTEFHVPYFFSEQMINAFFFPPDPPLSEEDFNASIGLPTALAVMLVLETDLADLGIKFVGYNPLIHDQALQIESVSLDRNPEIISLFLAQPDVDTITFDSNCLNQISGIGAPSALVVDGGGEDGAFSTITHCTWSDIGHLTRQFGFALGLFWEQTRPDRLEYIDLFPENLVPFFNTFPVPSGTNTTRSSEAFLTVGADFEVFGPYDPFSIMHADRFRYSINDLPLFAFETPALSLPGVFIENRRRIQIDDRDDLVVVNIGAGGTVQFQRNDETDPTIAGPTFSIPPAPLPNDFVNAGPGATAVDFGQINGDNLSPVDAGSLDVAVSDAANDQVFVFVNDFDPGDPEGAGNFTVAGPFSVLGQPADILAEDVSGDDLEDILTANQGTNDVTVLFNQGRGAPVLFVNAAVSTPPGRVDYPVQDAAAVNGLGPVALTLGDVTGDRVRDIITANAGDNTVSVLVGQTDGTFGPTDGTPSATVYPVGLGPADVKAADLDGDGDIDVIVANQLAGTIEILENDGTGDLELQDAVTVGPGPIALEFADLDADNDLDVVVLHQGDDSLRAYLNDGNADLTPAGTLTFGGGGVTALAQGNLNRDVFPDFGVTLSTTNQFAAVLSDGLGGFLHVPADDQFPVGTTPVALTLADVYDRDADGGFDDEPILTLRDLDLRVGTYPVFSPGDKAVLAELYNEFAGGGWFWGKDPFCPADVNEDGIQNIDDIRAFLNLFEAQSSRADITESTSLTEVTGPDGEFSLADVQAFLFNFDPGFCDEDQTPSVLTRPLLDGGNTRRRLSGG